MEDVILQATFEMKQFDSADKVKIFNLLERGQGVLEFSSPWIGGVNL